MTQLPSPPPARQPDGAHRQPAVTDQPAPLPAQQPDGPHAAAHPAVSTQPARPAAVPPVGARQPGAAEPPARYPARYPPAVREVLDRPRLLRLAIRAESVPAGGAAVAHGVVARIEGGFFVAGPPPTPFHTVALWAGVPPGTVSVGCVPTSPDAAVEVWTVHETEAPQPAGAGPARVERYGARMTLTCADPATGATGQDAAGLVVDLLWEDG
jgi:hypothetical protein